MKRALEQFKYGRVAALDALGRIVATRAVGRVGTVGTVGTAATLVVVVAVLAVGCASVGGDPADPRAGTGDIGSGDGALAALVPPERSYSPWPVSVDRGFRDGAVVVTDDVSFSHPAGWYFRVGRADREAAVGRTAPADEAISAEIPFQVMITRTTVYAEADDGAKLASVRGGNRLTGRVVVAPLPSLADTGDAGHAARFLQWVEQTGGEVVWSDEAATASSPPRPLFLALIKPPPDADDSPSEPLQAIAWQYLDPFEVVTRFSGPEAVVRAHLPDLIRVAKTVGPGITPGPGTGAGALVMPLRQLPNGLRFTDPSDTWRWSADLTDGFLFETVSPPVVRVAIWRQEGAVRFQIVSDPADEAVDDDPRVQTLLQERVTMRSVGTAGTTGTGGTAEEVER